MAIQPITVVVIALVFVMVGAVIAARGRPPQTPVVPPGAKPGDLFLEPCSFKSATREYQADCGTLVVPENRSKADSRLIAVPVKRIHSASPTPAEPIFYLAGGPGASNMKFKPPEALLANHDVVIVGYRGVDGSVQLHSPEYAQAMLGVRGDVTSDESLALMAEAARIGSQRLAAEGVDLAGYTLVEVVEDMETVRLALGYERLNLLSESYGTRIAQVFAYLHPNSVKRSAMIGVNPPGRFVWEPETIDAQIEYYGRLWAQDAANLARTPDLTAMMRRVSQNMPRRWLIFPIDPGKVKAMSFMLFFSRNTAAMVFDAYLAADGGDASGLALMSLAYDLAVPRTFVLGDLFAKAGSADLDPVRDYVSELRAPDSILGSPVSLLLWGPPSQGWPQHHLPPEFDQPHPSEVETLLVSGSNDFSTPAEFAANDLLPSLKNGRQVILSEMGHVGDVWGVQPEGTERLLTSFYDTGVADDSLYTYAPMDFNVRFGFPLLAKLAVGLMFILFTGVVASGFAARKIRHRNAVPAIKRERFARNSLPKG